MISPTKAARSEEQCVLPQVQESIGRSVAGFIQRLTMKTIKGFTCIV
jgi:hypothetical protein